MQHFKGQKLDKGTLPDEAVACFELVVNTVPHFQ